jgi:hypothetical protein
MVRRPPAPAGRLGADVRIGCEVGSRIDTFAENPPNAFVSCPTADGAKTMTVTLSDPRLDGDSLSYAVDLVDGALTPSEGPVSTSIH